MSADETWRGIAIMPRCLNTELPKSEEQKIGMEALQPFLESLILFPACVGPSQYPRLDSENYTQNTVAPIGYPLGCSTRNCAKIDRHSIPNSPSKSSSSSFRVTVYDFVAQALLRINPEVGEWAPIVEVSSKPLPSAFSS